MSSKHACVDEDKDFSKIDRVGYWKITELVVVSFFEILTDTGLSRN